MATGFHDTSPRRSSLACELTTPTGKSLDYYFLTYSTLEEIVAE